MKFDPFVWTEVKPNEEIPHEKGRLHLRASQACPLYIMAQGVEALFAVSTEFSVDLSEAVTFRLDAPEGVRLFLFTPDATSFEAVGEVYTNIDRMTHESGQMMEVRKALRQLEIERRATLREIRAERDRVLAARAPAPDPKPEPEAEKPQDDDSDKDKSEQ